MLASLKFSIVVERFVAGMTIMGTGEGGRKNGEGNNEIL